MPIGVGNGAYHDQNVEVNDNNEAREVFELAERAEIDENQRVQNVTEKEEVKMEEE